MRGREAWARKVLELLQCSLHKWCILAGGGLVPVALSKMMYRDLRNFLSQKLMVFMSKWKTRVPQSIQNKNRALRRSHGSIIFVNKIRQANVS